jgi:hypothetical protein
MLRIRSEPVAKLNRHQRNTRTSTVREAFWSDFYAWCAAERIADYYGDRRAQSRNLATQLVVDVGDLLLEFLIVAVTEFPNRPRRDLRRDEQQLTEALHATESVKHCWVFLAYATAARSAATAFEDDDDLDERVHRDAARLIAALWPPSEETEDVIDVGFNAEELGYWSLEWVYTRHALSYLIGRHVDDLAFFRDLEPYVDLGSLARAWNQGFEPYVAVVERATLQDMP